MRVYWTTLLFCLVNYRSKRVGDPLIQDAVLGKKFTQPRRLHGGCKDVPKKMNLRPSKLIRDRVQMIREGKWVRVMPTPVGRKQQILQNNQPNTEIFT